MPILRRSFDFADFQLSVKSENPVSVHKESVPCEPELPKGMRVDFCVLDSVAVECVEGSRFTVLFEMLPAQTGGWEASPDPGEALEAIRFESRAGDVASIAMRDPEWMEQKYNLRLIGTDNSDWSWAVTYQAKTSTRPRIEVAVAWIKKPLSDQEALSPWFAVDKALNF
jgi:hypothetical protein